MSTRNPYSMPHEEIEDQYHAAWKMLEDGKEWREIAAKLLPSITQTCEVRGIEHIPKRHPFLAVTNHPSHMDYFFVRDALAKRPDLRIVARVPPEWKEWVPSRSNFLKRSPVFLPLESLENGTYVRQGLQRLTEAVRTRTSLTIVPWGCMDHQAAAECTVEQAVENIARLAEQTRAQVLSVSIHIESQGTTWPGSLPFQRVLIEIGNVHNTHTSIEQVVTEMYAEHVTGTRDQTSSDRD